MSEAICFAGSHSLRCISRDPPVRRRSIHPVRSTLMEAVQQPPLPVVTWLGPAGCDLRKQLPLFPPSGIPPDCPAIPKRQNSTHSEGASERRDHENRAGVVLRRMQRRTCIQAHRSSALRMLLHSRRVKRKRPLQVTTDGFQRHAGCIEPGTRRGGRQGTRSGYDRLGRNQLQHRRRDNTSGKDNAARTGSEKYGRRSIGNQSSCQHGCDSAPAVSTDRPRWRMVKVDERIAILIVATDINVGIRSLNKVIAINEVPSE